jgi:nitrite reductase/ring-hydroxylating ferredoxin subunit
MSEDELQERGFIEACGVEEVGAPLPKRVEIDGRGILLCRDDGKYYAVGELCPHENQSMKFGVVFQGEITCPHHQYRFKLGDGRCNRRCAPLQTFPTEVFEDRIWVKV